MGSCGGGETCEHVPYARGTVDVAVRELPGARARNVVGGLEVGVARGWGEQFQYEGDGRVKSKDY
jgi:hypothetical protein